MAFKLPNYRYAPYMYKFAPEIEAILPKHYLKRCKEFMEAPALAVHWHPDPRPFKLHPKTQEKVRIQNVPVKVLYPIESNNGLWGGEGLLCGLTLSKYRAQRMPNIWKPFLTKRILYSEIFDKFFNVTVTLRTLDLIDECFGFDNYILQTDEVNLNSQLGMKFKRDMLIALATKSFLQDQPEKQSKLLKRYDPYILPLEEAEWIGLPGPEAIKKAQAERQQRNPVVPLKRTLKQDLLQQYDLGEDSAEEFESMTFEEKMDINRLGLFNEEQLKRLEQEYVERMENQTTV